MTLDRTIKRDKIIFTVSKAGESLKWEIRETRTLRWYCYDETGYSFAWSFLQSKAEKHLRKEATRRGFVVAPKPERQKIELKLTYRPAMKLVAVSSKDVDVIGDLNWDE